jgi:hypothetical protein
VPARPDPRRLRNSRRFQFEHLEARCLLAIDTTANPLGDISPVSDEPLWSSLLQSTTDDAYEENDTRLTAYNFGQPGGPLVVNGLQFHDANDYYRFSQVGPGTSADYVRIDFQNAQGNLNLSLLDSGGTLLAYSNSANNFEQLSLAGRPAGTYYVRVYGAGGAINPNYSLTIDPATASAADDAYEENDTLGTAFNLGEMTGPLNISGLKFLDANDYYQFSQPATGQSGHHVRIDFQNAQGNLNLSLLSSTGTLLAYSNSANNFEQLSLAGRPAGSYYVRVYGAGGAINPNYSLTIHAGGTSVEDAFEENDLFAQASTLGTLTAPQTYSNLALLDSNDWYRFSQSSTGGPADRVTIDFSHAQGNLSLALHAANGAFLASSAGTGNSESITLNGRPAGEYYVRVLGHNGATNPSYSLTIDPSPQAADDVYENNDTFSTAYNFGTLTSLKTVNNLVMADGEDWFRFHQNSTGTANDLVRIEFLHSQGDVDLALYAGGGQFLASSTSVGNFEQISLNGRPAGDYVIRVYGYQGATNPNYSLKIDPAPSATTDDGYENNDTFATAHNFGTLSSLMTVNNLVMADGEDWYRFHQNGTGTANDYVRVEFLHSQGDIDLGLYTGGGQFLAGSTSIGNFEQISLSGLGAGDYVVRVYGYQGATNPNYSLRIDPSATSGGSNRVLYLNFDGASISYSNLVDWAADDWQSSINDYLDPNHNGIQIQPLLASRGEREAVIQGIVSRVQIDLSPWGIAVQRHFGLAVENQDTTTIFLGPNGGLNHVACDIDFGNNNSTDIAFVTDEWWGNAADTILALADVALHEAGHTYGLYHVNTLQNGTLFPESMGLRYSSSSDQWVQDTRFMNQWFDEYLNHGGGRGPQNTYLEMSENFGSGGAPPEGGGGGGQPPGNLGLPLGSWDDFCAVDGGLRDTPAFLSAQTFLSAQLNVDFGAEFSGAEFSQVFQGAVRLAESSATVGLAPSLPRPDDPMNGGRSRLPISVDVRWTAESVSDSRTSALGRYGDRAADRSTDLRTAAVDDWFADVDRQAADWWRLLAVDAARFAWLD